MLKLMRLRVRVHSYATEDLDKVMKAVENVLGGVGFNVEKNVVEGHYGDPITVVECSVADEGDVLKVFRNVVKHVGYGAVGVEAKPGGGGRLHLRVDKQKAYQGSLADSDVDPVKLEFSYVGDWREMYRCLENT
ncbi:MAG: RNA-binding domain-containing protein [Candidatus Caldarchaeum sp.]